MTITFPSEVEYIETEDRSVAVQYTLGLVLSGTMGFCPFSTKETLAFSVNFHVNPFSIGFRLDRTLGN
jgi:hypothetical protein